MLLVNPQIPENCYRISFSPKCFRSDLHQVRPCSNNHLEACWNTKTEQSLQETDMAFNKPNYLRTVNFKYKYNVHIVYVIDHESAETS